MLFATLVYSLISRTVVVSMLHDLVASGTMPYIVLLLLAAALYVAKQMSEDQSLPPGPKRQWIIGNLLDIPRTIDRKVLASWKDRFGTV